MGLDFEWIRGNGPNAYQATLEEFVQALADEIEQAIDRLMEDVLETVRELAPVDTGQLRDSYETEVEEAMESAMGLVIKGIVESDVDYAPFQEFLETGTEHVAPAIEQNRDALEREGNRAWNRAVRKVS